MSFRVFILVSFYLISCNSINTKAPKATGTTKLLKNFKDPLESSIPDSMKSWIPVFDSILKNDSKFRSKNDRSLYFKNEADQTRLDSINQIKVIGFLEKYGYPEIKQVGVKGNLAIRMVIQHSPVHVQETYFGFVTKAFIDGKVPGETVALLEDRINFHKKRKQYYGTQVMVVNGKNFLYPLVDPDSVNIYRKRMRLIPLKDYLKLNFNLDFHPEKYKKSLPGVLKYREVSDSASLHFTH